jgi:hypothetical protein
MWVASWSRTYTMASRGPASIATVRVDPLKSKQLRSLRVRNSDTLSWSTPARIVRSYAGVAASGSTIDVSAVLGIPSRKLMRRRRSRRTRWCTGGSVVNARASDSRSASVSTCALGAGRPVSANIFSTDGSASPTRESSGDAGSMSGEDFGGGGVCAWAAGAAVRNRTIRVAAARIASMFLRVQAVRGTDRGAGIL